MTEVRLNDRRGKSAGNIDVVLVTYDEAGRIVDYGALEVQGVYISGNVRRPFEHYMTDPVNNAHMDWRQQLNYPRPDYLSSSRKRLAPQLIFKGGIIRTWTKKIAVALNSGFYATLPPLPEVDKSKADIAWLIYELQHDALHNRYMLRWEKTVYTRFDASLEQITRPEPGAAEDFISYL